MKLLIQLVREFLQLSGKGQGKVMEFQKPLALAMYSTANDPQKGPQMILDRK